MTDPERYIEWLERLEIPISETATIEAFQDYLMKEGFITAITPEGEMAQADALWSAVTEKYDRLAPLGVTPVLVEYPWGEELRFGIKGYRGLFGAVRMKEITGWEAE